MSQENEMPNTNITVDFDVREALDIIKRRDSLNRMSDAIRILLEQYEAEVMKDANELARIKLGWSRKDSQ